MELAGSLLWMHPSCPATSKTSLPPPTKHARYSERVKGTEQHLHVHYLWGGWTRVLWKKTHVEGPTWQHIHLPRHPPAPCFLMHRDPRRSSPRIYPAVQG